MNRSGPGKRGKRKIFWYYKKLVTTNSLDLFGCNSYPPQFICIVLGWIEMLLMHGDVSTRSSTLLQGARICIGLFIINFPYFLIYLDDCLFFSKVTLNYNLSQELKGIDLAIYLHELVD
ncbi:hypothetical protein ACJX0J_019789, partial [Zea mays]